MTDYFDELERELRRAHRRDTARHARFRVSVRRRLPSLPASPGRRTLKALAAVAVAAWLVAIVVIVGQNWDVERQATVPQPSPTTGLRPGCDPSDAWEAPIVDEPIPQAIASRFAIFRDGGPKGELPPGDVPISGAAMKLYRGSALTLRPRLDTGARFTVALIAADVASAKPDRDWCAPPPGPIEPGICLYANSASPPRPLLSARCFTIDEIEDARAWLAPTRRIVIGLAPDGVDRVTFDTSAGTESLNISGNFFAGALRSADNPPETDTRFAP